MCVVCHFKERMETANKQLATRDCDGTEDNRKTISQLLAQSMENNHIHTEPSTFCMHSWYSSGLGVSVKTNYYVLQLSNHNWI